MQRQIDYLKRWRGEIPILAIGLVLLTICIGLLASRGIYPGVGGILAGTQLFTASIFVFAVIDTCRELNRHRPDSPLRHMRARYASPALRNRAMAGIPMLVVCIVLLPFFSRMKAAIPLFNEYTWDDTFIAWDRAIFFGHDAWEVLQPVLGFPIVTAVVAVLYHLWLLLLYPGCLFLILISMDETLRRQFFLSYVLSWTLIGGALATLFASVGPCFVGPMLGDHRFDAQMAYLNAANEQFPIMVLPVQQMLLDWFHADANGLGSGITAMPSMHVAIAFLFWLTMRKISRGAGRFFFVFFVITWAGSVHTAYHYAVDGLVSVVAVAVIWWVSRQIIVWWDEWGMRRAQAALRTNTVPAE